MSASTLNEALLENDGWKKVLAISIEIMTVSMTVILVPSSLVVA